MNFEIAKEEASLLDELLSKELHELPIEIHHTKTPDFKEYLKEKQRQVDSLLTRLRSTC